MPPRTSIEQRSVAPVKSSAIAPSSMALTSRWEGQYVAVPNGYGKPAAQRLTQPHLLPACIIRATAIDQCALHAKRRPRNVPVTRRRSSHESACGQRPQRIRPCCRPQRAPHTLIAKLVVAERRAWLGIKRIPGPPRVAAVNDEAREERRIQ